MLGEGARALLVPLRIRFPDDSDDAREIPDPLATGAKVLATPDSVRFRFMSPDDRWLPFGGARVISTVANDL